jgi:hypothetical protein
MTIAGLYSFKDGKKVIESRFGSELQEIKLVIAAVDARSPLVRHSGKKSSPSQALCKPKDLSRVFRQEFESRSWKKHTVRCEYPTEYYIRDYTPASSSEDIFREMDFVKNRVGVEVQFGKCASAVYDICAKMTIFHEMGVIDVGVQIVPVMDLALQMSSGLSYFEQFAWDLEHRGVADIDIPVLILGITA